MGNNQNPHMIKKKHADGNYDRHAVSIDDNGYFAPKKSNAEVIKDQKSK
ncbi:MAG: hypothetical protein ACE3JP_05320 [Ectobacillus sp.]